MITRFLLASVILGFASLFSGCETTAAKQGREMASQESKVFSVEVAEGSSMNVVKNAIILALSSRNWVIVEQSEGLITATLDHRNIHGNITISYTASMINIEDHSTDANGAPFVPVRWIKYLMMDISKSLPTLSSLEAE